MYLQLQSIFNKQMNDCIIIVVHSIHKNRLSCNLNCYCCMKNKVMHGKLANFSTVSGNWRSNQRYRLLTNPCSDNLVHPQYILMFMDLFAELKNNHT